MHAAQITPVRGFQNILSWRFKTQIIFYQIRNFKNAYKLKATQKVKQLEEIHYTSKHLCSEYTSNK